MWPHLEIPAEQNFTPEEIEALQKEFQFKMDNFTLLTQFIEENGVDCDLIKNGAVIMHLFFYFLFVTFFFISSSSTNYTSGASR